MSLNYSYDPTTSLGQVRLNIGDAPDDVDTLLSGTARNDWKCLLADEEIQVELNNRSGDVLVASAALLMKIASTAALTEQAVRLGDYSMDTRKKAEALRNQANGLLEQANSLPAEAIVEQFGNEFQVRELITRSVLGPGRYWELP